jgi:hypothetical protein
MGWRFVIPVAAVYEPDDPIVDSDDAEELPHVPQPEGWVEFREASEEF